MRSPTSLRVGGEQIIMLQRQFSACVLRLKLCCDIVHRDPARSREELWSHRLWHKLSYFRCAPLAAESFVFAFSFDEQLPPKKKESEGIVMAELWFHLAQPGMPGGSGYSVLLSPESDCREDCVQMEGRYREPQ